MKKNVLLAGILMLSTLTTTAQTESIKPEKGAFLLEAGIAPFAEKGSIQLQEGQFKVVYMASDKIGIRIGLGFNTTSASEDNGLKDEEKVKAKMSATEISFTPGLICYFSGTEKLSPYIGAELILATESNRVTVEAENYKQVIKNEGGLMSTVGLGLFSGFNYYVAKNLYVGAEINIALRSKSLRQSSTETIIDGDRENSDPPKDKVKHSEFKTSCSPLIRLGWSF
jgi:outer membrane protein W